VQSKDSRAKRRAIKILQKSLAKGSDIEIAIGTMRKKSVTPANVVSAISEVLHIPIAEADQILLNSQAFQEVREETLQMREALMNAFEEDADYAFDTPDGHRIIHVDLENEEKQDI